MLNIFAAMRKCGGGGLIVQVGMGCGGMTRRRRAGAELWNDGADARRWNCSGLELLGDLL